MKKAAEYLLRFLDGIDHVLLTPARTIKVFFPFMFSAIFMSLSLTLLLAEIAFFFGMVYIAIKYFSEYKNKIFKNDRVVIPELMTTVKEIERLKDENIDEETLNDRTHVKFLEILDTIIEEKFNNQYHYFPFVPPNNEFHFIYKNSGDDSIDTTPSIETSPNSIDQTYSLWKKIKSVCFKISTVLKSGIVSIADLLKTKPILIYLNIFWFLWMAADILVEHFTTYSVISHFLLKAGLPLIATPYLLFAIPFIPAVIYMIWWAVKGKHLDTTKEKQLRTAKIKILQYAAVEIQNEYYTTQLDADMKNLRRQFHLDEKMDFADDKIEITTPAPQKHHEELLDEMKERLQNTYPTSNMFLTFIKTFSLASFGYWIVTLLLAYATHHARYTAGLLSTVLGFGIPLLIALVVTAGTYLVAKQIKEIWQGLHDDTPENNSVLPTHLSKKAQEMLALRKKFLANEDTLRALLQNSDAVSEELETLKAHIISLGKQLRIPNREIQQAINPTYDQYRASLLVYPQTIRTDGSIRLTHAINFLGSAESMSSTFYSIVALVCTLWPVLGVSTGLMVFLIGLAVGVLSYAPFDTYIFHKKSHEKHDKRFLKQLDLQIVELEKENHSLQKEKLFLMEYKQCLENTLASQLQSLEILPSPPHRFTVMSQWLPQPSFFKKVRAPSQEVETIAGPDSPSLLA